jgi:hypothetical protein
MRLNPTPTPKDDEQYEDRCHNFEAECHARPRHKGEDLIWCTHMQREEYNINQRAWQLDVHEAHVHRCDLREAEIHAARMSSTNMGRESGSE